MRGRFVLFFYKLLFESLEYIMLIFNLSVLLSSKSLSSCKVTSYCLNPLMFVCEYLFLRLNFLFQYLDPLLSVSPNPIEFINFVVQFALQLPVENLECIDCLRRYHELAEDIHIGQLRQHHCRIILPIVRHYTKICSRCNQIRLQQLVVKTPRGKVAVFIKFEDNYLKIVLLDLRHISCQELQLTKIHMKIDLKCRVTLSSQLD